MLGTTIAHYRVLERLGEGGMGEVFLAEDLHLQRRAALKLISPALTRDETRRQRFVQEARLAASIDHPHIAAIYDIGEVDGRTYIAMEYVEGGSLREVLKAGPLKLRQALDYAVQAGDALAKVHGRGVVHRDLKPENLLIAKDGYLKIIDFGPRHVGAVRNSSRAHFQSLRSPFPGGYPRIHVEREPPPVIERRVHRASHVRRLRVASVPAS